VRVLKIKLTKETLVLDIKKEKKEKKRKKKKEMFSPCKFWVCILPFLWF